MSMACDKSMIDSLIALGANLHHERASPAETLARSLGLLKAIPGVAVTRISPWYRTPAYPAGSGPDFVNGAAMLKSKLDSRKILSELHRVEAALGRERPVRWAPRVCDLDLLGHGDEVQPDVASLRRWMALDDAAAGEWSPDEMILPHPRMHLRAFVLVPLNDIAPDWVHPVLQLPVSALLARLAPEDVADVRPL